MGSILTSLGMVGLGGRLGLGLGDRLGMYEALRSYVMLPETSFSEPVPFEVEKMYTLIADAPRELNAVVCSIKPV